MRALGGRLTRPADPRAENGPPGMTARGSPPSHSETIEL